MIAISDMKATMKIPRLIARTLILSLLSLSMLLSAHAQRINIREPVPPPAHIRRAFDLDPFYQQWIDVRGFPVLASGQVNPYAVKEAAYLIHSMIGHRRDILRTFAQNKERFSIVGYDQGITEIPEYSYLKPDFYIDIRSRGFGSAEPNLTTSTSEENLLHYPGDPYFGFSVFLHELAHAVHERGLSKMDPGFDDRLRIIYAAAMAKGLWKNTYAAVNRQEYWAEASEAWFNPKTTASFDRFGDTREDLKAYDPEVAALIAEVYGDGDWRYTAPKTRLHQQHLQGFDPQHSPTFQWPPDKMALHRAFTSDPESTGDGRWVNLQAYPPSELPRLQASIVEGAPTIVAIGNFGVDDVFMYEVPAYGVEWAHGRLRQDMVSHETHVGRLWLLKDSDGTLLSVYRAVAELGRVLIFSEGAVVPDGEAEGVPTDLEAVDNSPRVKIPDANLAAAVRRELGLAAGTPITRRVMQRLTTLHAPERQIKHLKGLEHATALVRLDLWENHIQNVNPLSNLKQLRQLHLQANRIRSIKAFAGLTALRDLHLWGNQIRDISPLSGLTRLESLWLAGNPIQDMSPLHSLLKQNPDMELDIAVVPPEPVVHVGAAQRPPMYWIDVAAGTLHRLVGDEVEAFMPNVQNATRLSVDAARNKIYWTEQTGKNRGRIRGANLDGSNLQILATSLSVPTSIALDTAKGKLYWTDTSGRVKRVNLNGKQNQALIKNLKAPNHITVDSVGRKLYWTEASGRIRRANLNGKRIQNVASGLEPINGIAIFGDKLYWIEKTSDSRGKIGRANLNGSDFETLVRLQRSPLSLAVDPVGRKLYWTDAGGNLRRADLNGKHIQNVVSGLTSPIVMTLKGGTPAAAPVHTGWMSSQTAVPDLTRLFVNYPNPFNPETWIPYQLVTDTHVKITIYTPNGVGVRTLSLGYQTAGDYTGQDRAAYWDGRNALGERVASGLYLYTLTAGEFTATRRLLIRK